MYARCVCLSILTVFAIAFVAVKPVAAQAQSQHQHSMAAPSVDADESDNMARDGSGTSWLPDMTPMYAIHKEQGSWQLMLHENAFIQYLDELSDRGDDQFGSINWIMGMAQRPAGKGRVTLRGMFSLEPWTIAGCGYPDLVASGEICKGEKIHDRQHPHDLMMEIAATYDAPLARSIRWQVYGGPVGEPALGPVAYPHRISALPNPIAPIAHHWLDSTHITFGVVTGGVYGKQWKAEGSVFNGREPDEHRTDFDFGALDSFSGRVWFLPTAQLAVQFSAGKLTEAEASDIGGPRVDATRVSASATYHAMRGDSGMWATTLGWGRNEESGHGSNALLAETSLTLQDRDALFGRFEVVGKTAHDLALDESESDEAFMVSKLQGGYTRYFASWRGLKPGIGATVSAGFVPEELKATYGSRVNFGYGVFLTLRPAAMMMHMGHEHGAAAGDHSHHGGGDAR